jgi:type I restriction enzyme S subunit
MSWQFVPFGNLTNFRNGLNYSRENFGSGLKIISVADFGSRWMPDYASLDEINPAGVATETDLLKADDLLFVRSNGNRDLVGRVLLIAAPPFPVGYSGFCIRARMTDDRALPGFYAYLFRSPAIRRSLTSGGVGANILNVSQKTLSTFKVPLPPLSEQHAIVWLLQQYDELIATNQRRIQLLEESARLIYREWFVHLRFPGHESVPVKGGVPEGWQLLTLGDVCDAVGGGTPSTTRPEYWGGDVVWVTPTDVTRNDCLALLDSEKKITEAGLANSSAKLVPPETILMTSRASIGFFALMDKPACTNQGFISVLPKQANTRMFLLFNLLGRVEEMIGLATGATFKELSKKTFRALPVLWPTEPLLESFEDKTYPLIQQVRLIKKLNEQLAQARDLLLPKLMSGQLDVSGIPLPAEVAA